MPRSHACALRVAAVLALPGVVAACGGSKHETTTAGATTAPLPAATQTSATAQPPDVFSRIPRIVRAVQPQVVTVLTQGGVGSGVIFRPNGVILTNDHVVHGAAAVEIAFADGRRVRGNVMAVDPDTDLALVKVDRNGLPAATFQQGLPAVGSLAVVLGCPLGFDKSVSAGIVSGLHRSIPGSARETTALVDLLQTDAPISPGNSGGAVVDSEGHVIGISEAYIPPQQGVLVELAGEPLDSVEDLFAALRHHRPGQEVAVGLVRNGARRTAKVQLSAKPAG